MRGNLLEIANGFARVPETVFVKDLYEFRALIAVLIEGESHPWGHKHIIDQQR